MGSIDEDDNILAILDNLDQLVEIRQSLSAKISSGWMNLAKSRYSNVSSRSSTDDLRYEIDPNTLIDIDTHKLIYGEDNTGISKEAMMLISALPDHYLRHAQKSFVASLQLVAELSRLQHALHTRILSPEVAIEEFENGHDAAS